MSTEWRNEHLIINISLCMPIHVCIRNDFVLHPIMCEWLYVDCPPMVCIAPFTRLDWIGLQPATLDLVATVTTWMMNVWSFFLCFVALCCRVRCCGYEVRNPRCSHCGYLCRHRVCLVLSLSLSHTTTTTTTNSQTQAPHLWLTLLSPSDTDQHSQN